MITGMTPPVKEEKEARIHVLKELGGKFRVITVEPLGLAYAGHRDRIDTFPLLKRIRSTSIPLREGTMRIIVKNDNKKRYVYSADLSSATDHLSYNTIERVCQIADIPASDVKSHPYLYKRKGEPPRRFTPKRGTFMGLPPSWVVLSLSHEGVCRLVDPTGRSYFLKGDDLIAYWTIAQWNRYTELMTLAGFKVNLKKTFRSKTKGWFCEKGYALVPVQGPTMRSRTYILELLPLHSQRYLFRSEGDIPGWITKNSRFARESGKYLPVARKAIRRRLLAKTPLPFRSWPKLPIELGGCSLPKNDSPYHGLFAKVVTALHDGRVRPIPLISCSSPLARKTESMVKEAMPLCQLGYRPASQSIFDSKLVEDELRAHFTKACFLTGSSPVAKTLGLRLHSRRKIFLRAALSGSDRLKAVRPSFIFEMLKNMTCNKHIIKPGTPVWVKNLIQKAMTTPLSGSTV
jgi:hypothetical protein